MEQPREPKFYPNNNGISYADIRIAELEKKVANLEEKLSKKYSKEKKPKMYVYSIGYGVCTRITLKGN